MVIAVKVVAVRWNIKNMCIGRKVCLYVCVYIHTLNYQGYTVVYSY